MSGFHFSDGRSIGIGSSKKTSVERRTSNVERRTSNDYRLAYRVLTEYLMLP